MAGVAGCRIGLLLLVCIFHQQFSHTVSIKCYLNLCNELYDPDTAKPTGEYKCNGAKDNNGIGKTMPCSKGSYCAETKGSNGFLDARKCERDATKDQGKMPFCEPTADGGETCYCKEDLCNKKFDKLPPLKNSGK